MAFEKYRLENLSPSTQMAVIAALGLALSAAIYFVFLQSLMSERGALQAEVGRLEKSVAQAAAFANQLARHKKELVDLEARLRTLKAILPDQKETPIVLRSVQQMASSSNLKIHKFDPQPVVPKDFYSDWPIAMQVEGSYNAVGEFFEKIGRAPRIINVDNISLKGIDGSTDAARTVNATCTAITFVFREQLAPQPASN
jgi:type IV pilus assembly protein PilO